MTEWKGTIKGTEDTYPHLSSVRDRFKENDDIVHAAICDAALSLISEQSLEIHRLRESMRILSYLDPSIKNYVDNPWAVAHQVREHVRGRIAELETALNPFALSANEYDNPCFPYHDSSLQTGLPVGWLRQARKVLGEK